MLTDSRDRPMALIRRKAGAWRRMSMEARAWFLMAYPLLGLARLILLAVPFRCIAPWLGQNQRTAAVVPLASQEEITRALAIGRAVRIAARHTPWESKCLAQAIVARVLLGLKGLPYALFLGVRNDPAAGMTAHAWVCTGRAAITGGQGFGHFTVVGTFVSGALPPETRSRRGAVIPSAPGRGAAPGT